MDQGHRRQGDDGGMAAIAGSAMGASFRQGDGLRGGRTGIPRRHRRWGELCLGVTFTLLLHGAIIALLMWQTRVGPAAFSAANGPPGVTVSMVSLPMSMARQASPPPDPRPQLDELQRRLAAQADTSAAPAPTPPSPSGAKALMKLFDDIPKPDAPAAPAKTAGGSPGAPGGSWAVHPIVDRYALASVVSGDTFRTPSPGLWPQVARCWRGAAIGVAVEMQITLDDRGGLVGQPTLTSPASNAPDTAHAEAEARRALLACAPYKTPPGVKNYAIRFGAAAAG